MRWSILTWIFLSLCPAAIAQDSTSWLLPDTTKIISDTKSFGQETVQPDASPVTIRSFDETKMKELRAEDDLNYQLPPSVAESIWDRLMLWLDDLFSWLFRNITYTDWGRVFLYTVALIVIIIVVMLLLKVDALRVFYSGADKGSLNYTLDENIHEMDFDKLIREALKNQEFRLAVRLTFLQSLKLLSDKHHLEWRPGKTNNDYQLELKDPGLKTGFNELSFYFDYAWYGEFAVNENLYRRVHDIFEDWKGKIE